MAKVAALLREIDSIEKSKHVDAEGKRVLITQLREQIAQEVGQQRLALGLPESGKDSAPASSKGK